MAAVVALWTGGVVVDDVEVPPQPASAAARAIAAPIRREWMGIARNRSEGLP